MGEEGPFADVLQKVRFLYPEPIDFTRTDSEAIGEIVRRLVNAAYCFNLLAVSEFGGRSGRERSPGLVEQIVGAAFQTFADEDPHPHPFEKAAMLLRGITQGHPFMDANKRTGFLTALYYLEQVSYPAPQDLPVDEVVDFCVRVSAGTIREVEAIAIALARFWNAAPDHSGKQQ